MTRPGPPRSRSALPRLPTLPVTQRRSLRLAVARHRRLLAAGATAAAVAATIQALVPSPPPVRTVWVAARDLPAGHRLGGGDLRRVSLPAGAVPDGTLPADATPAGAAVGAGGADGADGADGAVLAAPVRRGEPVTDVRLLGPGLLAGRPPGTVAVTVRVADPAAAVAVRAGSRVDVLALPVAGAEGWSPQDGAALVASGALVLALPGAVDPGTGGGSGGLGGGLFDPPAAGASSSDPATGGPGVLLLAVDRATAAELAAAQAARSLTVVLG